jgi:hypothetical protein
MWPCSKPIFFETEEPIVPAKSEKQRKAAAIAKHHPEQLDERNKGLADMTDKQLGDFARKPSTPKKGKR